VVGAGDYSHDRFWQKKTTANKSKLMTVDHLRKVSVDFHTEDEMIAARQMLDDQDVRLRKRRGDDKLRLGSNDRRRH